MAWGLNKREVNTILSLMEWVTLKWQEVTQVLKGDIGGWDFRIFETMQLIWSLKRDEVVRVVIMELVE